MNSIHFLVSDETRRLLVKAEHLLEMLQICFVFDSGTTASLDYSDLASVMTGASLPEASPASPTELRNAIRDLQRHVMALRAIQIGMAISLPSR